LKKWFGKTISFIKTQNQTIMIKSTQIHTEGVEWIFEQRLDVQLSILSNHLEICKAVINSVLQRQTDELSGPRYCRVKPFAGRYGRWGINPGSVRLGNQKLSIAVPRIRDKVTGIVDNVQAYDQLKDLPEQKEEMIMSVLKGISMRDYSSVATQLMDSFGLSASSISRHFVEYSSAAVDEFCNRHLDKDCYVGLFIDGKSLGGEQMIIAMGVTDQGVKKPLAVIQSSTENSRSIREMLSELIERGFNFDKGLLVIIDGSKGLYKAVRETFGHYAVIQRCQWHKRENVVSYLKEELQNEYRHQLQQAYKEPDYHQAKAALTTICEKLKVVNLHAARSLEEGLEETLTIHRLGLKNEFGKSFTTTNCIESLNSQIGKHVNKVKRWTSTNQRMRWVIMAMIEAEDAMQKVSRYKSLHLLQAAVTREMEKKLNHFLNEGTLIQEISTKNAT
jgi:transposase-like protein